MRRLKPKVVRRIFWIALATGVVIGYLGAWAECSPLINFGVAILVCLLPLSLIFYRCPHCGRHLDRSTGDFCPYCGENVNQ